MRSDVNIHLTATVSDSAQIGPYTSIWHYCNVERTAVIGENCNLGQNCYVGNNAVVGNGCRLGNSVSVFNNVILEDFVFCAPFMAFTHISFPRSIVKRHHVFEKTLVKRGATLGANSTITPGVTIGEGAFIGGGAVVSKNCKAWGLYVGVPAKQVGWVSAYGEKIDLPLQAETGDYKTWTCPHSDDRYTLEGDTLRRRVYGNDVLEYEYGRRYERLVIPE